MGMCPISSVAISNLLEWGGVSARFLHYNVFPFVISKKSVGEKL